MPRFAADAIAPSKLGRVLAIAERLDTLAGGFAAGLKPTGNKDPFALRRNALGLARTLIEGAVDIDLPELLRHAENLANDAVATTRLSKVLDNAEAAEKGGVAVQPAQAVTTDAIRPSQVVAELYDFILDRLRSYYGDRGVPVQQFEAVAALRPPSLLDFDRRLAAIGEFATLPEAEALAAANKRIRNILKKAEGSIPTTVDSALYAEAAERELAGAVDAAIDDTDAAFARRDYVAVLGRLARLRPQVDAFFDGVLVNADDPAVRGNRLALLQRLADRLGGVAAIEYLSA
jgi:glycyl-tRNA synthetase beta chain